MNERIKELMTEAGYEPLPGFDFANSIEEVFINKFAELIVRECVGIVEKRKFRAIDDQYTVDEAMTAAEIDLIKHFGV